MKIRIVNKSKHKLPSYSTDASAGMDLRANLENDIILKSGERALVPTGLYVEIPVGYEAQIRPRSGLAINKGVTVLNSPGTIDADYRGEICIIIINFEKEDFIIKDGDRICQMIITKHEKAEWLRVERLEETNRGGGGFGHTGKK
jgi:dUTP pyrophosphatase